MRARDRSLPSSALASLLPSPGVRFAPDFAARVGAFVARFHGAGRREGRGRGNLFGVGEEFVGHRPYRPGDDPRGLDWSLYARADRPYVRVMQREASERWTVLLDASASMGVGIPGKLQCAAEAAAAIAASGLRAGAGLRVLCSSGRSIAVHRPSAMGELFSFLEGERAHGSAGLGALFASVGDPESSAWLGGGGRIFVLGDLFDVGADVLQQLARRGRELAVGWILARAELTPSEHGAVEWVDPESGEALSVDVDARTRGEYERALARELERWRDVAGRHRVAFGAFASVTPFETVARALLAPA